MTSLYVDRITPLRLNVTTPLDHMRAFAPFVWQTTYGFEMLLSAMPRGGGHTSLYHGVSSDGVHFAMDRYSVIDGDTSTPGRFQDACVVQDEEGYVVYFASSTTGHPAEHIAMATGENIHELQRITSMSVDRAARPELVVTGDGGCALFYERRDAGAPSVACARAPAARGPWSPGAIALEPRDGKWDAAAVTTGPVVKYQGGRLMFYAGAGSESLWHVGWVVFSDDCETVRQRCDEPLALADDRGGAGADVLAASSVPIGAQIWLYAFGSDTRPFRAILRSFEDF